MKKTQERKMEEDGQNTRIRSELGYQKSGATSLLGNSPKSEFRMLPIT
jgi:hypothetical protein